MRKKLISVILCIAMTMSLAACGGSNASSKLIDVKGAFYCNEIQDESGFSCFFIVLDYINDATNRTLPESGELVTLALNDTNSYEAVELESYDYDAHFSPKHEMLHAFEKYSDYEYLLGYGNLLGGADPERMFVAFYANPNDLKKEGKVTLTIDDQKVILNTTDFQKISTIDGMLTVEDEYETAQSLAAFKWRLDKAYITATFVAGMRVPWGSQLDALGTGMETLFSENVNWGISVMDIPFSAMHKADNGDFVVGKNIDKSLPVFDRDIILEAYPELAEEINTLIDTYISLSKDIRTVGTDDNKIEDEINLIRHKYVDICNALDTEIVKYD